MSKFLLFTWLFLSVKSIVLIASKTDNILIHLPSLNFHPLPRFWTSTGFCPPAPINKSSDFLLSDEVKLNIEYLAALPNLGITHVRTHWILELVTFLEFRDHNIPVYDFRALDEYIDHIVQLNLNPAIEFMGNPSNIFKLSEKKNISQEFLWEDLVFQITDRYIRRYGVDMLNKWRFETWNEPDLANYNILDYTLPKFIGVIVAVKQGLVAVRHSFPDFSFQLRGPAGLFKAEKKHPLCYGILSYCKDSGTQCPVDLLTFHRKGQGHPDEIVNGGIELIRELEIKFPYIRDIKFANDEADPTSGWSKPLLSNSGVDYAAILVETVFQHWNAKINGNMKNLESISHDNAFLSFHPYEFAQRTLLARFRMNLTLTPYTEFIQKPVYTALGFLSNLGGFANHQYAKNISILISSDYDNDISYFSILATIIKQATKRINFRINIKLPFDKNFTYFVEALQDGITDPSAVWKYYGSPSYPNKTVLTAMRLSSTPQILFSPAIIEQTNSELSLNFSLRAPFLLMIRICDEQISLPGKIKKLRIRKISDREAIIFWSDGFTVSRCVKTYEVYFNPINHNEIGYWILITAKWHVPFNSFHFIQSNDSTIYGRYKARGVDMSGRYGKFSKIYKLEPLM